MSGAGMLRGKNILLGISGSIAAYKSAYLVRELVKRGAEVQVICTPSALDFVTPLTLGTLSRRPVLHELIAHLDLGIWNNHVALGEWADMMVLAPASANTLAKMASGEADNLLLTTFLSARGTVFFAPAMDLDMHAHPATQENIRKLTSRGNVLIPAESGELASGLEGTGRMAEPEHIARAMEAHLMERAPLAGKRVLITAGPTQEAIDPVRYLGNRSSGKMGYALAAEAHLLGAEVVLISGPVHLEAPKGIELVPIVSAEELYRAATSHFEGCHVAVCAAAVADFRPMHAAEEKIKKEESESPTLELTRTPDTLQHLGQLKRSDQYLVGFALETEHALANARKKLDKKNCDLIVLNSLRDEGAGFGHDTNKVSLVTGNNVAELGLMSKSQVAAEIWRYIITQLT